MREHTTAMLPDMPAAAIVCHFCGVALALVHGHGQCVNEGCPQKGVNQDPCCQGERQWTS